MRASTLAIVLALRSAWAAFYYPNPQIYLLEHILVDNWGAHSSNFSSAITPCTRYVTETGEAAVNSGRTTAAQWMRVLFHDFITADVVAGTGGIDASIGFETARAENKGSAFNDSFTFWGGFVNEHVSMADLVALGTVMANNLCGGKLMTYQPGRIDATGPDPTSGVPAPETGLEETLHFFKRAGFNQTDSIALTACGHTLGSVHHGGFPEVVDNSTVSPTNTNGGANFDSSRGVFDPLGVHEYLSWTGQKGGPLVTSFNESSRSDLRLYKSDGNATMEALQKKGDSFLDTCIDLLGRVTNTVPSHVVLKDPIQALDVKPVNTTFNFDSQGRLLLTGSIRILNQPGIRSASPIIFSIGGRDIELLAEQDTGISVYSRTGSSYGTTSYHPFAIPGDISRSATNFSVQGKIFAIQSDTFIVPSMTVLNATSLAISVAVSKAVPCADLQVTIAVPTRQQGTLAPKIVTQNVVLDDTNKQIDEYTVCSTLTGIVGLGPGSVTVTISNTQKVLDILLLEDRLASY